MCAEVCDLLLFRNALAWSPTHTVREGVGGGCVCVEREIPAFLGVSQTDMPAGLVS